MHDRLKLSMSNPCGVGSMRIATTTSTVDIGGLVTQK